MKARRENLLLLAVLLLLLTLTLLSGLYRGRQEARLPLLSSLSSDPDGGRALYLWLQTLGYTVSNQPLDRYEVPDGVSGLLLLHPIYTVEDHHWQRLQTWVENGGVLLINGQSGPTRQLAGRLGYDWEVLFGQSTRLGAAHSGLQAPAPQTSLESEAVCALRTQGDGLFAETPSLRPEEAQPAGVLLATPDGPAALTFAYGRGRIILACAPQIFSNAGLKDPVAAQLALNLLALLPKDGRLWIDEWHHGERASATRPNLNNWLRQTSSGRAILYSGAVLTLALALGGLALGRPLVPPRRLQRRGPVEHVVALANLNRRAGHRRAVLEYHHQALKRRYGRRYRIDPTLPDEAFIAALRSVLPAGANAHLQQFADLLRRLSIPHPSDAEMVRLAAEAAAWLEQSKPPA